MTLRAMIGGEPFRLQGAFDECDGRFVCTGQNAYAADVVNFRDMPDPRAVFLERLWWDGQDGTALSTTTAGQLVGLAAAF